MERLVVVGYKESLMGAQDISLRDIVRGQRGSAAGGAPR